MTTAVIPLGRGRPPTLPYVIRALTENAGVTRIVTVGERPTTIEPDHHIDSPNFSAPYINVAGHLRAVIDTLDVSEFVWCDDDTICMTEWTPGVYVRKYSIAKMLATYPNVGGWSKAVKASISIMRERGLDPGNVPCGTIHRPWLVESDRVADTLDALAAVGGGSFKALYVAGLDGVVAANDPKVHSRGMPAAGADVISVVAASWKQNAGRIVRETFTTPTVWEI